MDAAEVGELGGLRRRRGWRRGSDGGGRMHGGIDGLKAVCGCGGRRKRGRMEVIEREDKIGGGVGWMSH